MPIAQEGDTASDLIIIVDGSVSVAQPSQAAVLDPQASGLDPGFSLDGSKFGDGASKFGDGPAQHRTSVAFSVDSSVKPPDVPARPQRSSVLFALDEAVPLDSPGRPQRTSVAFQSADGSYKACDPLLLPHRSTGRFSTDGSHPTTCDSPRVAWAGPYFSMDGTPTKAGQGQEPLFQPRPSVAFSMDNSKSLELLPHRQSVVNASAIKISRLGGGWCMVQACVQAEAHFPHFFPAYCTCTHSSKQGHTDMDALISDTCAHAHTQYNDTSKQMHGHRQTDRQTDRYAVTQAREHTCLRTRTCAHTHAHMHTYAFAHACPCHCR